MTVDYISFSAHSDYRQTSEFIDELLPPYIVCLLSSLLFSLIVGDELIEVNGYLIDSRSW